MFFCSQLRHLKAPTNNLNSGFKESFHSLTDEIELGPIAEDRTEESNFAGYRRRKSNRGFLGKYTAPTSRLGAFPNPQDDSSSNSLDKYSYHDQHSPHSSELTATSAKAQRRASRLELIRGRRENLQHLQRRGSVSRLGPNLPIGIRGRSQAVQETPSEMLGNYAGTSVPISWINYFVAFAVAYQSILNGFIFGTGTLLMFEEYDMSRSLIGTVYSCSAITGVIASLLPLSERFVERTRRYLPSPHNY